MKITYGDNQELDVDSQDDLAPLKVNQLKEILTERGLDTKGLKAALAQRLWTSIQSSIEETKEDGKVEEAKEEEVTKPTSPIKPPSPIKVASPVKETPSSPVKVSSPIKVASPVKVSSPAKHESSIKPQSPSKTESHSKTENNALSDNTLKSSTIKEKKHDDESIHHEHKEEKKSPIKNSNKNIKEKEDSVIVEKEIVKSPVKSALKRKADEVAQSTTSSSPITKKQRKEEEVAKKEVATKKEMALSYNAKDGESETDEYTPSNILFISNFVRPFTIPKVKELLGEHGTFSGEDGFWMNQVKSHCYITYDTIDMAKAAKLALDGLKWPATSSKNLAVEFSTLDAKIAFINSPAAANVVHRKPSISSSAVSGIQQSMMQPSQTSRREVVNREAREGNKDSVTKEGNKDESRDGVKDGGNRDRANSKTNENPNPRAPLFSKKRKEMSIDDLFKLTTAKPHIYYLEKKKKV